MAGGIAGQGMILLKTAPLTGESFAMPLLHAAVDQLLARQRKDGSWPADTGSARLTITGFADGMAGIICFLLEYYQQTRQPVVRLSVIHALHWLVSHSRRKNGQQVWYINNECRQAERGAYNGMAGILLAFVKACQILGDPGYRSIAENELNKIPPCLLCRDLTLATGIVGIAELYLEAFKVFHTAEWEKRAHWIAASLQHHFRQQADGSRYWMPDTTPFCTADLMTGNSGILHFLLRYSHPGRLTHPLLIT
jgi:lantibiotic modifying enzyme